MTDTDQAADLDSPRRSWWPRLAIEVLIAAALAAVLLWTAIAANVPIPFVYQGL